MNNQILPGDEEPGQGTEFLDAALGYATLGYPVFPCVPDGKNPLTPRGFHDASTDHDRIREWWARWPDANIAIATANLLIVDVDGQDNPWPCDQERKGDLADCPVQARTPRGGHHFIFRQPLGRSFRCTTGRLAQHVDTRADGGYLLVAPSRVDGKRYSWLQGLELNCHPTQLSEPPRWLVADLEACQRSTSASTPQIQQNVAGDQIPEGQRNSTLTSMGGAMRRNGFREPEILTALNLANQDRCQPPLGEAEVHTIARSVARYQPQRDIATQASKNTTTSTEPVIVCMADVEPEEVSWLWPGRVPLGRLTLLAGPAGLGKSMLTADMASRITRGSAWPDGSVPPNGSVLLITAEDDPADTIRPRLDAAGADVRRVSHLHAIRTRNEAGDEAETMWNISDCDMLSEALDRLPDCKLVVIDPIGSYLGGGVDAHRDNEVRQALAPLARLASERGIAILLVAHVRKGASPNADDMVLGSRAFTALCRGVLHLVPDESNKERRLLLPGKSNLARQAPGLAFVIVDGPKLDWESGTVDLRADDHYAATSKPGPEPEGLRKAETFLRSALASGPRPSREVEDEAWEQHQISERTLNRARKSLGVTSYRNGKVHYIKLDSRVPLDANSPQSGEPGTPGTLDETSENQGFQGAESSTMPGVPGSPPSEDDGTLEDYSDYDPREIFGIE